MIENSCLAFNYTIQILTWSYANNQWSNKGSLGIEILRREIMDWDIQFTQTGGGGGGGIKAMRAHEVCPISSWTTGLFR